ncbi:flagellar basal body-associated FliL family protein [Falsirhodobacter sp. 20TX0035]|uniref:flagellar basal body-associated FliL family protein n=1 Tax=Falsirhodobacter sp. 20TX0035 TaxID=3022019 RepID=UPI00232CB097|nr:flagellar basal body-associated FliL family protein [Falsirhodobacter sp. 20TX0035]MDB6452482.1 flagellar basal body-associated FliL family protein [Falsirhodobacter sp. 20TX0035]
MKKILLPLILILVGAGAGVGAGLFLHTPPEPEEDAPAAPEAKATDHDYVKLSNQFVIPVVATGRVTSMVVLSLSLEVTAGETEAVFAREPKLRDSFLQVLFDFANTGGFQGSFTDADNLVVLRRSLLEAGERVLGDMLSDVLIVDIMRQDS